MDQACLMFFWTTIFLSRRTIYNSYNVEAIFPILLQVFVANPNKPREIKVILAKNHEKLMELLHDLSPGKG